MKKLSQLILAAVIVGSALRLSARAAESFSVLLQKGIFAEETEGNLDAAIKIYQQITTEGVTNHSVVAQAQYRLGVCYQKKGSKEQAISALNDLLKQFPAEAALGQKARKLLTELGQRPSSNITIRQLPLTADQVHSVSSDGRLVAFKPKESSNVAIYEMATGKTWTAIKANAGQYVWNALISPDARLIVYQLESSNSVYLAKIDGSDTKQVYPFGKELEGWINDWSPDGGQLIVNFWDEKSSSVATLDLKTGTMKEIKRWTPSPVLWRVCLSPDGRYVACRVGLGSENRRKIIVLDLRSATETTVVEKGVGDLVGWSSGGARLVFLSDRTGTMGLWAITVREGKPAGEPELVKANVGEISNYGITRDGCIYYTEAKSSVYVYLGTANFQTGEISDRPRRVTDRFPGLQTKPVWSRNGEKLMISVQGDRKRFVTVSLGSGEQKEFPVWDVFTMPLQQYAWSPDEAFLLVQSGNAAGVHGIHRYELASGTTETLVAHVEGAWSCHPRLSPDGSSFYYARRKFSKDADNRDDWKDCVVRRDLRSGREEIVYDSPEKLQIWWPFELSPDGERLAIVVSDQFSTNDFVVALKVRGLSGSETKELVRTAPRENITSLAWTPDGKRLVYTKELPSRTQGAEGSTEVWTIAVDSGQSVELKFSLPRIRHLTIHPDGRQIAFLAGLSGGQDLWVMEGLMPKAVAPGAGEKKD
jgi:Tol biopolymer transport system component